MQFAMAFKIIGVLLILFSTAMLPSLFLSLAAKDGIESAFATGLATTLFAGVMLWLPTRHLSRDLNIRDGFLVTRAFLDRVGAVWRHSAMAIPRIGTQPGRGYF